MGKKETELERQKTRFVEGAFKNGISKDIAAGIFLKIEPFAGMVAKVMLLPML